MKDVITAYLGTFEDFEEELVLEILRGHDIFATPKHNPTDNDHAAYSGLMRERGVILVDATRVEDARRIIAEELPQHLASIQAAMEEMERAPDMPPLEATMLEDAADRSMDIADTDGHTLSDIDEPDGDGR